MTGEVTIDTQDLWTVFGAFLLQGSYNGLLAPPKRKASLQNNWPEQDGIDIDLADPHFEAKDVDLSFIISASSESQWWTRYNAFVTLLTSAGERALYVTELGQTFNLFYKETGSYEQLTRVKSTNQVVAKVTVKFCMKSPV